MKDKELDDTLHDICKDSDNDAYKKESHEYATRCKILIDALLRVGFDYNTAKELMGFKLQSDSNVILLEEE